jgi:hypothetical protein
MHSEIRLILNCEISEYPLFEATFKLQSSAAFLNHFPENACLWTYYTLVVRSRRMLPSATVVPKLREDVVTLLTSVTLHSDRFMLKCFLDWTRTSSEQSLADFYTILL